MKTLWLLTEERPKTSVVREILKYYCEEKNVAVSNDSGKYEIRPGYDDNGRFNFTYQFCGLALDGIKAVRIEIVSGGGSFVDYVIVGSEQRPADGQTDNVVMLVEETKTSDDESRNTGVYQRATKFVTANAFFGDIPMYMLYNDELTSIKAKKPSDTNIFGTRCLLTLGVKFIGKDMPQECTPFKSVDDMISAKGNMKKPPSPKNVPLTITKEKNRIVLTGKLDKKNHEGQIAHDPNEGALSLMAKTLRVLGWAGEIVIKEHNVSQKYLNGLRNKNKFLYVCELCNVVLDGVSIPKSLGNVEQYWHYERSSEKVASILLHLVLLTDDNVHTVYQNHAGCERGYFKPLKAEPYALPKKDEHGNKLYIPDVVLYNAAEDAMLNIEGKKESTMKIGLEELDNYDAIESEHFRKFFPTCTISRYLSLFGGNAAKVPNDKTLVQVNADGSVRLNGNAPTWVKAAFTACGWKEH